MNGYRSLVLTHVRRLLSFFLLQVPDFSSESLTVKKFVLVHGEGFGAWCWYKIVASLEESGLSPITVDLTGSGFNMTDTNTVSTLEDYSKPLIEYLENLPQEDKVRLCFEGTFV